MNEDIRPVKEIALELGISRRQVWRIIKKADLNTWRDGRRDALASTEEVQKARTTRGKQRSRGRT